MTIKNILKYLFFGIAWGCTFFVIINLIGYVTAGPSFLEPIMKDYAQHALGTIIVGIACGSTSIIYSIDKIPGTMQVAIHFIVGLSIYFFVAFRLGWMPTTSIWYVVSFVGAGLIIFLGIWFIFYFYNIQEAKKLNEKLKELKEEKS